ncbi:hypothetical protein MS2017_2077 [Bathymodiolus thermophilus thioautotrophic gill symbiont]|uniref:ATP-binding protein n=1 Tax=Bathymodiolus thermophilus thioautotrophic gill symbiont TaxID=2360 RepID=A0A3G3IQG7_9GAMM|nr:ATP-binding protein [Bathymodiolus thermophilus thioautotrophic gill symbiont]AYQ57732.1 hypothetical protein MS2017_2077 [Bathymodiolus thermophilus thioautotrophic gill symbiont]
MANNNISSVSKYELTIDLNALNHLGLNLYSNVPAVLSEIIANSWDADSENIKITTSNEEIKIVDDGCGMTTQEMNKKFLTVGRQRRRDMGGDLTPKFSRQVMGRKGIGKLSIFSIANDIEIHTKKKGKTIGIKMNVSDIIEKIESKEQYFPDEIGHINIESETGTVIILRDIKKRVQSSINNNLKKRISRRFDIFSDKFKVIVNGDSVTIGDRGYFHKLEFATKYGELGNYGKYLGKLDDDMVHDRTSELNGLKISGWIGLSKESGSLEEDGVNLNKISILSRGKVALEDILVSYREGGLYTKFLIGEIRADFLDDTDDEDIATSSRQDFIQDDKRFIRIKEFIENELKYISNARVKYKEENGTKMAIKIPAINEWFNSLQGDAKKSAKSMFGKINAISLDDDLQRKSLYKQGVIAFETLHHKEKLSQLDNLNDENFEQTLEIFSELDDIEASWYYQITVGRLSVIQKLQTHIEGNALEKVVQEYIYEHLWLLDPSWERATEPPIMEKKITSEFSRVSDELSAEEKNGRVDIKYRKTSGKHIIIELKRSSVKPKAGNILEQVKKYKRALKKQLDEHNETGEIEVICLVGNRLSGWEVLSEKESDEKSLMAHNITVITYQQLIKDAENSYKSYLDKGKDKGRIQQLLQSIDDS